MRQRLGVLTAIILLLMAYLAPIGHAERRDWDNDTDGYLTNGGFEGTFYNIGDEWIAAQWTRLYLEGSADWDSTCRFVNGWEYCDAGWVEKIAGKNSHLLSVEDLSIGQPFNTVLYQRVEGLVAGRSYSFSGWTLKMWGGSANHTPPSDPRSLGSRVGVDPTGGTDPTAATVLWDEWNWEFRADRNIWLNQRLAFTAQGAHATVFVQLWHRGQRAETQVIVDAMELFDAPSVAVSASTPAQPPSLSWVGTMPAMFASRGPNFHLHYDVQRQQPDGSWLTLLHWTTATSYTPTLTPNESATFRVVPFAYEPPGSPINWPPTIHVGLPSAPVTLLLDGTPPTAHIVLPGGRWHPAGAPLSIEWRGHDDASGVASYDVEYRSDGSSGWQRWFSATPATSALFPQATVGGQSWEFRVRARDHHGNEGQWSAPERVSSYGALLTGHLLDATGSPLLAPTIEVAGSPFAEPATVGAHGEYRLYLAAPGPVTLAFFDVEHRQRLPTTTLTVTGTAQSRDWSYAPEPNAVTNGHFEQAGGWAGSWIAATPAASGVAAAQLGVGQPISQSVGVGAGDHLSLRWQPVTAGARLRLSLGGQQWLLDGSAGSWQPWHAPAGATGTQPLTLEAVGGLVLVDQVGLGAPDPVPLHTYLPLSTR